MLLNDCGNSSLLFARAPPSGARLLGCDNLGTALPLRLSVARASQSRTTVIWGVAKTVWSPGSLSAACSRARKLASSFALLGAALRLRRSASERYRWTILDGGIHTGGRALYVQSLMTCDRAVLVMRTSGEQKRQKVQ